MADGRRGRYWLVGAGIVVGVLLVAYSALPGFGPPKTAEQTNDHVVVVGDSYTTGPNDSGTDPEVWPAMVWKALGSSGYDIDPTVSGEGGAGYAHPGYRGGTFADKARVIEPSTDLIVFFGSANDMAAALDAVRDAARATLRAARLTAPKAHMLVIGPAWPRADVPQVVWQLRDIVRDQATVVGATFVDPLAQRWLWDDADLIGPDGIHPNRAGQQYLADKIRPLIEAELPRPHT